MTGTANRIIIEYQVFSHNLVSIIINIEVLSNPGKVFLSWYQFKSYLCIGANWTIQIPECISQSRKLTQHDAAGLTKHHRISTNITYSLINLTFNLSLALSKSNFNVDFSFKWGLDLTKWENKDNSFKPYERII